MPTGNNIDLAIDLLNSNKLVAIPTETVYGLAANAFSNEAVLNIYKTKNRPQFNPLIIHSNSISRFQNWGLHFTDEALLLAEHFWPGPLTLIVPASNQISEFVTASTGAVAVRVPNHPITLQLLQKLDFPLAAPSANPSGYISPTTSKHVEEQLGNQIDYILEGGNCEVGIESTIISFLEDEPVILRYGGLAIEQIEKVLNKKLASQTHSKKIIAPGMLTKHYATKHKLMLTDNIEAEIKKHNPNKIGTITFYKTFEQLPLSHQFVLSKNKSLDEAAQNLFETMHQIDELDIDIIIAEKLPNTGLGYAINDRLKRASVE